MRSFIFPGQGSQKKGMGGSLFDEFNEITKKADSILGYSIKELCLNDPDDKLGKTEYTQPALYVVNALMWLKVMKEKGEKPDFLAGHSLGEYNALLAAGVFDFETGLKLVKERSRLMSGAKGGGMAAIIGMDEKEIKAVLKKYEFSTIKIANYNAPSQIVISGIKKDVEKAKPIFMEEGAQLYIVLNVSGAFHTEYMQNAEKEFSIFLENIEFHKFDIPVISNVTARPYHDEKEVKELLAKQITSSVQWRKSIDFLINSGVRTFEEIGPGKVLTGLIKSIRKNNPLKLVTIREMVDDIEEEKFSLEAIKMRVGEDYRKITYGELKLNIQALGSALIHNGAKKGDNIAILSENRVEWIIVYLAIASIGAVVVPLDVFLKPSELSYVLDASDAETLFISKSLLKNLKNPSAKLKKIICIDKTDDSDEYNGMIELGKELIRKGEDGFSKVKVAPSDVCAMIFMHDDIFAMLTHIGLMTNAYGEITQYLKGGMYMNEGDNWLATLPFHHTYPVMLGFLIPVITYGVLNILTKFKTKDILQIIAEENIDYMPTVPLVVDTIYNAVKDMGIKLDSLKFFTTGGAYLTEDVSRNLEKLGILVIQGYGLTEYSPVVTSNKPEYNKHGSIGLPICNVEVKIDDPDELGNGEILARGPSIMKGYYKKEELTAKTINRDGWLHTGDIGRIDEDDFVYITGRIKNIIVNKGGKNLYPDEIERILLKSGYIDKVAVIPKLDPAHGETPYAFIHPNSEAIKGLSEDEVKKAIEDDIKKITAEVAHYKAPDGFELVYDDVPMDSFRYKRFMFEDIYNRYVEDKMLSEEEQTSDVEETSSDMPADISQDITNYLIGLTASVLGLKASEIDINLSIMYFMESIEIVKTLDVFKQDTGITMSPTILFEYTTIKKLSDYFFKNLNKEMSAYFGKKITDTKKIETPSIKDKKIKEIKISPIKDKKVLSKNVEKEPIAIIGMSGMFPQSKDLEEFFKNLEAGEDLISEVPRNRFNWEDYLGDPFKEKNKTNTKWGGFLEDIDKFDASFFNISRSEAELMDPQQRLFFETVWKTIEDAGYRASDLAGSNTGIFAGVENHDYADLLDRANCDIEAYTATGEAHSILVNRISHLLDISGPSIPIPTACSSSLVAIHQAIIAIRNGDCDLAIAGGVNTIIAPKYFVSFSKAGLMAPDGRCKTFSKGANGYARGEGVGAVMLKPLGKARKDNDNIYAIIRGTAINHGGRASSLTAPNPAAQADLLIKAFENAEVSPEHITYIEAHGTGTELGDPVEIIGLQKAFSYLYEKNGIKQPKKNYCGLSSVKSNIGHLEMAAGIAGVIKVALAMKHKKIPASINFTECNPYIDLKGSPFYIATETREWERLKDANNNIIPRIAGVSSFGFGGVNAHVVIEEYEKENVYKTKDNASYLFVLSAKNEERLKVYAENMANFLNDSLNLADIAYTLQVGREAMQARIAAVVSSVEDLKEKLNAYCRGKTIIEKFYIGNITKEKEIIKNTDIINNKEIEELARLWTLGADIDWKLLYTLPNTPNRISLPVYPFAREKYWPNVKYAVSKMKERAQRSGAAVAEATEESLMGVLKEGIAAFGGLSFDTSFESLGLDSLTLLSLRQKIQTKFGVKLDWNSFIGFGSPKTLLEHIKEKIKEKGLDEEKDDADFTGKKDSEISIWGTKAYPHRWYNMPYKNELPIIIMLTTLRHGSSLSSFILNAHPNIFSPQGLYLLPFTNLKERKEELKKQPLFLEEGLIMTVQELWKTEIEEAYAIVDEWTNQNLPIQKVYQKIQEKCAPKILVDRGTVYGFDIEVLERAEKIFANPKYLHLIRHPYSVLYSGAIMLKKTMMLKNIITEFDNEEVNKTIHKEIDYLWGLSHANILRFFDEVGNKKWHRIKFEELVTNPHPILEDLCRFLELPFSESMLNPYSIEDNVRMHNKTGEDGIAARDPKLMKKKQIEPKGADRWQKHIPAWEVSPYTENIALQLGYKIIGKSLQDDKEEIFVKLNAQETGAPIFFIPGAGGNIQTFIDTGKSLTKPSWALQLPDYAPLDSIQSLASFFTSVILRRAEGKICGLVGFSAGSPVAWETARQLTAKGIIIENLIMVDRSPFDKYSVMGLPETWEKSGKMDADILALIGLGIENGIAFDKLETLWKELHRGKDNGDDLQKIFINFIRPLKIEKEEIDAYVMKHRIQRKMLTAFEPSPLADKVKKTMIWASESKRMPFPVKDIKEIVIPNCGHFSIWKTNEIKKTIASICICEGNKK